MPNAKKQTHNPDEILVTNYSHALKWTILGEYRKALEYCNSTIEFFKKYKANNAYRINFSRRCSLIRAILQKDVKTFDKLIKAQVDSHMKVSKGNGKLAGTPEAEIYVEGVALVNLARKLGINPTFKDEKYIPEELITWQEKEEDND